MYSALLVRYLEDDNLRTRFRAMVGGDAGFSNHTTSKLPVRSIIIVVSGGGGDRVIGHGDNDGGDGNGNEPGQLTLTTLAQLQPSSPVWQRTTVCSKVEFF